MERLVSGISAINFHHCNAIPNENCAPNYYTPATMATNVADDTVVDFNNLGPVSISPFEKIANGVRNNVQSTVKDSESCSETLEFGDEICRPSSSFGRRKLPFRATKQSILLDKSKRRSIMKPAKRLAKATEDLSIGAATIKKLYLNKKLTNFRPTRLETIFEEPQADSRSANSTLLYTGTRKLKRSLSLCDGINTNKTQIKQRRQKIKKMFGRRSALKKISLDDFLHRLNNSSDAVDIENQLDEEEKRNVSD